MNFNCVYEEATGRVKRFIPEVQDISINILPGELYIVVDPHMAINDFIVIDGVISILVDRQAEMKALLSH